VSTSQTTRELFSFKDLVVCDSYVGNDKEFTFSVDVGEGEDSDEDSSDGDEGSDVEMADA
jgi:hypothetical protein